ncbi:hypothetical protein ACFE04_011235 [Oxalis oulophora]
MENVFSARGVSADPSPLFPTQTSSAPPITATATTISNLAIGKGGSSGRSSHAGHQALARNVDVDDEIGSTASMPSPLTSGSSPRSSQADHQALIRNVGVEGGIGSSTSRPSPLMNGLSPPGFGRSTRTTLLGFGGAGSISRALASGPSSLPPLPHIRAPKSNFSDLQVAEMVKRRLKHYVNKSAFQRQVSRTG